MKWKISFKNTTVRHEMNRKNERDFFSCLLCLIVWKYNDNVCIKIIFIFFSINTINDTNKYANSPLHYSWEKNLLNCIYRKILWWKMYEKNNINITRCVRYIQYERVCARFNSPANWFCSWLSHADFLFILCEIFIFMY